MPPAADAIYPGAREPIWYGDRKVYSVTGFTLGVRSRIIDLPALWVEGELSELRHQQRLSLVYFTLKDPNNGFMLSCNMPRTRFESFGLDLRDGDLVQVHGRPDIYAARGTFQMRVQSIEHAGRGLLMQQLEALKDKLSREGLFDDARKRQLPFLPRRVGVITGADAAAQGDFVRNVTERFPPVRLVIFETLVQGERAAPQLVAALRRLQQMDAVDVIVITRGGGAFEDFLPFWDERLCRAIAACPIPVVSAIGHEKDSPLSDLVADVRESTPTAAARTVVPDHTLLVAGLERARLAMRRRGSEHLSRRFRHVEALKARLDSCSPGRVLDARRQHIAVLAGRSRGAMLRRVELAVASLARDRRDLSRAALVRVEQHAARQRELVGRLRALSPAATLERGYAIVRRDSDGAIIRDAASAAIGDRITIKLASGMLGAKLDTVEPAP